MVRSVLRHVVHGRTAASLIADRGGTAALEFAIAAPALLLISVGMLKFGIALSHYLALTNAGYQGATVLAFSRGNAAPYTNTISAITGAAPSLVAKSITTTVVVGGTKCADDSTCKVLLVQGANAKVSVTYPCDLMVLGVDLMKSCTLTGNSTQMVQ